MGVGTGSGADARVADVRVQSRSGAGPGIVPEEELEQIARSLFNLGMVEFAGTWTLKGGSRSPVYVDLRPLPSFPDLLAKVARAMLRMLGTSRVPVAALAGLPASGLPLAVAMGLVGNLPAWYPRETEAPGRRSVEGRIPRDASAVAVDDVLMDGSVKAHQVGILRRAGVDVRDVAVVVDRDEGGRQLLWAAGLRTHALLSLPRVVEILAAREGLAQHEVERYARYRCGEAV